METLKKYETSPKTKYRSYPRRWLILASVLLLNLANYSHWISYASVQSKAAAFYDVSTADIQTVLTVSYSLGVPCCCAATYVLAKKGLRTGILIGAGLTFTGGLLCCLATLPGLRTWIPTRGWYWMTLVGQALTGMGSPFITCVPTKAEMGTGGMEGRTPIVNHELTPLFAGTSRNIYPLAAVQGCLATTFRCSFHLWQQIMQKLSIEIFQVMV